MITEIERHRTELESLCRRFRVGRLEVFGSAVSGNFRESSSDLDFLVEFQSPESPGYADRYFGMLESLEALFARPVELLVISAIRNPYFQESVDRTRTILYAA